MAETIIVEIAYARPERQVIVRLSLTSFWRAPICCAAPTEAITASGLLKQFPDIDLRRAKVGIFSKLSRLDTVLNDGDRVEIYRPLEVDPKQARRRRAAVKAAKASR